jgi:hypothetical protein
MLNDVDLAETYHRLTARWLWVVAAAFLGGLVGLLASSVRPPQFEAEAVLGIAIDYARADVPDDITVRQAFDRVRGLLLADDTLESVLMLAAQRGGEPVTPQMRQAFRDRIRLSERPDGWVLAVQGADGQEVERLAQAWAETAVDQLNAASTHAIRAAEWQNQLYEVSCRLVSQGEGPARWVCRSAPPVGEAESIPASILAEVMASRGIPPVLTYSMLQDSRGTGREVVWGRASLVVGGAIAGLMVGALAVALRKNGPHVQP